jgi:hypothetical protein
MYVRVWCGGRLCIDGRIILKFLMRSEDWMEEPSG